MKILLDECVTKKLRRFLPNHNVSTVSEMKWKGLTNGKLMTKCVENGFDILLSIDKNIATQQSVAKFDLTIVVLDSENSKVESLVRFLEVFESEINNYEKRKLYTLAL